jgi:hypothetical protein
MLGEADSVSSIRKFSSFIKAPSKVKDFGIWAFRFWMVLLTKAPEINRGVCDFGLEILDYKFQDLGILDYPHA